MQTLLIQASRSLSSTQHSFSFSHTVAKRFDATMRLITHNYLQSNVKGTEKGYPLIIEAEQVAIEETSADKQMLSKLLPKLDYAALVGACKQLSSASNVSLVGSEEDGDQSSAGSQLPTLPEELPDNWESNEALLANLHKALFDIHVIEGTLTCPDTGRKFPIKQSIPNMILHEDEI